jgi:DNA-binding GntR family transcriptional regulator
MNVRMDAPIIRRSLHDELVERLQRLIIEGELTPGEKVPEKELCERFNVSRTPMREALKVLANAGLVTLTPNRGASVTAVTVDDLQEVFPVMGALEALSGELACEKITDAELARVRALHEEMVGHYKAQRLPEYFKTNEAIHIAILNAARNDTLSSQHQMLSARVRRARYLANMTRERWDKAVAEHEDILAALEARDGPRLGNILKKHLKNKLETVSEWLKANG